MHLFTAFGPPRFAPLLHFNHITCPKFFFFYLYILSFELSAPPNESVRPIGISNRFRWAFLFFHCFEFFLCWIFPFFKSTEKLFLYSFFRTFLYIALQYFYLSFQRHSIGNLSIFGRKFRWSPNTMIRIGNFIFVFSLCSILFFLWMPMHLLSSLTRNDLYW